MYYSVPGNLRSLVCTSAANRLLTWMSLRRTETGKGRGGRRTGTRREGEGGGREPEGKGREEDENQKGRGGRRTGTGRGGKEGRVNAVTRADAALNLASVCQHRVTSSFE